MLSLFKQSLLDSLSKARKPILRAPASSIERFFARTSSWTGLPLLFCQVTWGNPYSSRRTQSTGKLGSEAIQQTEYLPATWTRKESENSFSGDYSAMAVRLIDKSKQDSRPIVFVTEDAKEDWWLQHNGEYIWTAARACGRRCSMKLDPRFLDSTVLIVFLEWAYGSLKQKVAESTIREAREVWQKRTAHRIEIDLSPSRQSGHALPNPCRAPRGRR